MATRFIVPTGSFDPADTWHDEAAIAFPKEICKKCGDVMMPSSLLWSVDVKVISTGYKCGSCDHSLKVLRDLKD